MVAANGSLESRAAASPQTLVASLDPKWAKEPPSGSIVSLDRSTAGATAIAVTSPSGVTFAVVEADGTAAELTPAPDSPFGPSVAWLDKDRLVVISEDSRQIPRLAVVDRLKGKIDLLGAIGGMRVFGLSPDRATLAAATESEVYVAPVGDWLANKEVAPAVSLKPSEVVWDLAVSADNSHLAMLSGTLDASGTATDIHEIGYVHSGSSWVEAFDLSVPFSRAAGQVWLD